MLLFVLDLKYLKSVNFRFLHCEWIDLNLYKFIYMHCYHLRIGIVRILLSKNISNLGKYYNITNNSTDYNLFY